MTHSRDFGPLAGDMRGALGRYTKEELIDLMTHLVRVYVLDVTTPLSPEAERPRAAEELAALTFPQLLLHLQMRLDHEELGRFRVSGDDVYVRVGDHEFHLEETPQLSAAPSGSASEAPSPAEEVPSSPVTGEPDFDLDDATDDEQRSAATRPATPRVVVRETSRPRPTPVVRRESPQGTPPIAPPPSAPSSPPIAPPPISPPREAPGDTRSATPSREEERERPMPRIERDPLPPLAEGDKEIEPSNRFADLELD